MKKTLKMTLLLILVIVATTAQAHAAREVDVMLKGQAQAITGYLRELSQTRYILQSSDELFEFGIEELISVNGEKTPARKDLGKGRLVYSTRYEKILPNGDVQVWQSLDVENSGSTLIESITYGADEREVEEIRNQEVRDQFGNELITSVTPRSKGGYQVEIRLLVPVVPMELVSLNIMRLSPKAAKSAGSGSWSYTFNVDFPEDRFFVRKVELPAGARVETPDGWGRTEQDGKVFLYSHFYFPAYTVVPQVVEYKLP